jgi:hypothetical protein
MPPSSHWSGSVWLVATMQVGEVVSREDNRDLFDVLLQCFGHPGLRAGELLGAVGFGGCFAVFSVSRSTYRLAIVCSRRDGELSCVSKLACALGPLDEVSESHVVRLDATLRQQASGDQYGAGEQLASRCDRNHRTENAAAEARMTQPSTGSSHQGRSRNHSPLPGYCLVNFP